MDIINEKLDSLGYKDNLIPIDGIVVAILTYMLSPDQDKMRNTLLIGGSHFIIHTFLVNRLKRCRNENVMSNFKFIKKDEYNDDDEDKMKYETDNVEMFTKAFLNRAY